LARFECGRGRSTVLYWQCAPNGGDADASNRVAVPGVGQAGKTGASTGDAEGPAWSAVAGYGAMRRDQVIGGRGETKSCQQEQERLFLVLSGGKAWDPAQQAGSNPARLAATLLCDCTPLWLEPRGRTLHGARGVRARRIGQAWCILQLDSSFISGRSSYWHFLHARHDRSRARHTTDRRV
jgi:hypothetical protein